MQLVRNRTMSENDAHVTTNTTFVTEKSILTDFLRLYKSYPCLWDQKHTLYGNREARQKVYEVLLEKYKLIHEGANVRDVKKKIEYMRCAYRREHKKVVIAQLRGEEHKPILWYYDLLAFLNDHSDFKIIEPMVSHFEESYQETHEIEDSDDDDSSLPKRIKLLSDSNNALYVSDHQDEVSVRDDLFDNEQEQEHAQPYIISNESEAFGRTVGFQLKELPHMQRVFAEKLISDVIFQARLGNLSAKTTVNLHDV